MADLQTFENADFGQVRIFLTDNGGFEILAKDVANALGYPENSDTTRLMNVPDDWQYLRKLDTDSGLQDTLVLNEPGLYFFLGHSEKQQALPFQKWLFNEVLPSLRKTGSYVLPKHEPVPPQKPVPGSLTDRLPLILEMFKLAKIEGNQLILALDKIHLIEGGYSIIKELDINLVAPQPTILLTPSEVGRSLDPQLCSRSVNKILCAMNYQIKIDEKNYEPLEAAHGLGVMLDTCKQHSLGTPIRQLKWSSEIIFHIQPRIFEFKDLLTKSELKEVEKRFPQGNKQLSLEF